MEIKINGKKADITLENEKTVSDIISSIEQWIAGSGHRISGFSVDGQLADLSNLNGYFNKDIDSVKTLDIITSSLADLSAESLLTILDDINEFISLQSENKNKFIDKWKQSPQANFISESMPDLYNVILSSFSGSGLNSNSVFSITEERLREIKCPKEELQKLKPLLDETITRLEDFALDTQTGKDARAAQTIQLFSGVTEKMLRIANQMEMQGLLKEISADKPLSQVVTELGSLIKEFLDAYERHDTVLAGDISEYEACGKLRELYGALGGK